MDESRLNVIVGVGKGAELLIVADVALVSAKFGLIFFDMIEPFNSVMSKVAGIFLITFFSVTEFTKVW